MSETHYQLSITAGPNYKDQKQIPVNTEHFTRVSSDICTADIVVRVQNYHGLPAGSPTTSSYFSTPTHRSDLYSLAFTFTPKRDLNAHDIVLGNDFDHPIRDKLPPGFQQAFQIVKWFIDPGMYADVHADEPYLYGPMLSSVNTFRVGPKDDREQEKIDEVRANEETVVIEEGADADGESAREESGIPKNAAGRKKHFLTEQHLKDFTFEKNRQYSSDFFNPYLDFNGTLNNRLTVCLLRSLTASDRVRTETTRIRLDTGYYHSHHSVLGRSASPVSSVTASPFPVNIRSIVFRTIHI